MRRRLPTRSIPGRLSTGAYILHAGWEKWGSDDERANGVHAMAVNAFPVLRKIPPTTFLKLLATGEFAIGIALLAPVVPDRAAGTALTGFAGGLLAMYLRTPTLRNPRSIWPSPAGIAVSKDVWMLGIGLGLMAERTNPVGR
jgi:hypothetical protein